MRRARIGRPWADCPITVSFAAAVRAGCAGGAGAPNWPAASAAAAANAVESGGMAMSMVAAS